MKNIKLDGELTTRFRDVVIASEKRAGSINVVYEGRLIGGEPYFDLMGKEFDLQVDDILYMVCRVEDSTLGTFKYFRKKEL